jgi:hypothetical protein
MMKIVAKGRAAATLSLTLCLLASQVFAAPVKPAEVPGRPLGELTAFGQVQVNGQEAPSGVTVFPGSRFATGKDSGALLNLGAAGRVRLSHETSGLIDFGELKLGGTLDAGSITVSKPVGVVSVFNTKGELVTANEAAATVFTLEVTDRGTLVKVTEGSVELRSGNTTKLVSAGQTAGAGGQQGQNNDDDDKKKGGWFWFGVAGFVAEVGGAIIWSLSQDDNNNTNPDRTPIIVSPVRG